MTIQIKKIKINRGGPLLKDFEMEPGTLNVIFGHNESGKTYLVEACLKLLFKNQKSNFETRNWNVLGSIDVSGLGEKTETFSKSSKKKLDQIWEDESQFPEDLVSLLVVKGGETVIKKSEEDGVGYTFLKNFLCSEDILDQIDRNISKTLHASNLLIVDREKIIEGPNRAEIKNRDNLIEEKDFMESLLREVEQTYASGKIREISNSLKHIESKIKIFERAKSYEAFRLYERIKEIKQENENIEEKIGFYPNIADRSALKIKIEQFRAEEKRIDIENGELANFDERKIELLKKIDLLYRDRRIQKEKKLQSTYLKFALLSLIPIVFIALLDLFLEIEYDFDLSQNIYWLYLIVPTFLFVLFFKETIKFNREDFDNTVLENHRQEYNKKYSEELTYGSIKEKLEEQIEAKGKYENEKSNIEERKNRLRDNKFEIVKKFLEITGQEISYEEWDDQISELESMLEELEKSKESNLEKINKKEIQMARLDVPEENFIEEPSDFPWNESEYKDLLESKREKEILLSESEQEISNLRTKVCTALKTQEGNWENLISRLREVFQEKEDSYIDKTAEILGKIKVHSILKEFREKENERIEEGLQKKEIKDALSSLTGRYNQIRKENEEGLVVVNSEDEEFSLSKLSTGAKDQVFLALRTGFAKLSLQSQSAFLILDDAFQHSDWERRKDLVSQIVKLAKSGWQIFYFTMDNHLKILFQTEGEKLGSSFKLVELASNKPRQE